MPARSLTTLFCCRAVKLNITFSLQSTSLVVTEDEPYQLLACLLSYYVSPTSLPVYILSSACLQTSYSVEERASGNMTIFCFRLRCLTGRFDSQAIQNYGLLRFMQASTVGILPRATEAGILTADKPVWGRMKYNRSESRTERMPSWLSKSKRKQSTFGAVKWLIVDKNFVGCWVKVFESNLACCLFGWKCKQFSIPWHNPHVAAWLKG